MICFSCRGIKEIAYTDEAERGYCLDCVRLSDLSGVIAGYEFLAATIPYGVGDRVECRSAVSLDPDGRPTSQILDGVGRIVEVSTDLKDLASLAVPMFRVAIEEKAYADAPEERWYAENGLELAEERVP